MNDAASPTHDVDLRPARIGDQGVLLPRVHRHGSLGTLVLQLGPHEQAFLYGDWRMVADLVEALAGERVEVVEAAGSAYGAHGIYPLDMLPT